MLFFIPSFFSYLAYVFPFSFILSLVLFAFLHLYTEDLGLFLVAQLGSYSRGLNHP